MLKLLILCSLFLISTTQNRAFDDKASTPSIEVCNSKLCDCAKTGVINCDRESIDTVCISPISSIDPNMVTELSMNANKITRLSSQQILAGKSAGLTKLILSNNLIDRIDDGTFSNTPKLEYLNLQNNKLTTLTSRTFDGLINLMDLRLDHNLIQDLSKAGSVFVTATKLTYLSIDWTPLKRVANETFVGLESLIELSMDHAELTDFPADTFKPFLRLETLSLRHNRLAIIPDQLSWLSRLKRLDLSGNPIQIIHSNSFRNNPDIRSLTFYNMPELNYVQDCAFCNLHELNNLEIVNCPKFNDIDPEAFGRDNVYFRCLITVDFTNNSLTVLDEDMLPWENISGVIRLAGNPWKCDCEVSWMINDQLKLDQAQLPVCNSPAQLEGQLVPTIRNFDSTFCIFVKLGSRIRVARLFLMLALVLLVACLITAAWYLYANRRNIKIRNLFYKPQLPKYAYRNLAVGDEMESENPAVVINDGEAIIAKNKVNRDLASRLADEV